MGSLSIWHWIIVIGLILVLFGRGKVSERWESGQGIKASRRACPRTRSQGMQPSPTNEDDRQRQRRNGGEARAETRSASKAARLIAISASSLRDGGRRRESAPP